MDIREYRPGDEEELVELLERTIRRTNADDYTQSEIDEWADKDQSKYRETLCKDSVISYVAVTDSIVGWAALDLEEHEIIGLYVDPNEQGQGLGTRLLELLERAAVDNGLDHLECLSSLTAETFYHDHGYIAAKKTRKQMREQELEVVKMVKRL